MSAGADRICANLREEGGYPMSSPVHCLIASSKGGVGKSTTALGLAAVFARSGRRVLLVDCDVSSRSLEMFSGAADRALFHLGDLILGRCTPEQALMKPFPELPELTFCPAPTRMEEPAAAEKFPGGFPEAIACGCRSLLSDAYDVVLWDTGSGYEIPRALAPLAEVALVCAEQSPASIRAASYTASLLSSVGKVRLVICSFDIDAARRNERAGMLEMIDRCSLKCAAVIPLDPKMMKAQENGRLPDPRCPAMQAYANLSRRLEGWDVPLFTGIRRMKRKHAL
ncbi:MAG: P-loop NTPase [Clostridia bacterium]|nr:P-loop NTPase [Clostridia bacterium]